MTDHHYARYTIYMLSLLNMKDSHPGCEDLIRHSLSVNRSELPFNRNAVDITIEQTINKHAKSSGGIIGFSRNYAAYMCWCMTRSARSEYVEATLDLIGMNEIASSKKDLRTSEILKSEAYISNTTDAINNFMNPFEVEDHNSLYCLSPGGTSPT